MNILKLLHGNIFVRRDASSAERAVIVSSVAEEYALIKRRYPGFRPSKQSLCKVDGKAYDVVEISNGSGKKMTLFFDVSSFYGQ